MSGYRKLLYHIIIWTKDRHSIIAQDHINELYSFIRGIIKNNSSHLYGINGIEDHIHMFIDMPPSISLADMIRDIKVSTTVWMKESRFFPEFDGWSAGDGSFTCSYPDSEKIKDYIENQHNHHNNESFQDEYRRLIVESGLKIDERFFP
jgi:putative transposase